MTRIADRTKVFVDHNVYLLGAGFSADAGIPVLDNFLVKMRACMNWLREENRDREFAAIRKVFDFRKKAASAALRVNLNLENIEDLFSLARRPANIRSRKAFQPRSPGHSIFQDERGSCSVLK